MDLTALQAKVGELLAPLTETTVVTIAGAPTSLGEVLGFVTGAACVYAVATQRLWNWPVGMANNVFFLILFFSFGLYADSALQVVFFALAAYGWWAWLRGGSSRTPLMVSNTTAGQWSALAVIGVAATTLLTWLLSTYTPSTVPLADATTTVLSLLATWGQCRKKVQSWYLWIAADVIYVPLYFYKDLVLTGILYIGFAGLCVMGLRHWRRELTTDPAAQLGGETLTVPVAA